LNRPQTPMHKARVAVGSPPSAPLNGITERFDKPLPLWGEKPVCRGSCKPPPESESRVHHSCARSVRSARRSHCGVPQLALGLTQTTAWRIEVAPVPGLSNVATPTKDIITIPITLYGYGNGDDAEGGLPRDVAIGGSMVSVSATKPVAVAVWFGL
jgi:hypothetical protein